MIERIGTGIPFPLEVWYTPTNGSAAGISPEDRVQFICGG